jgi:hypothetical protein
MRFLHSCVLLAVFPGLGWCQNGITISSNQTGATVTVGGKTVTSLVTKKDKLAKPYLYPILAPSGEAVTRDWPLKDGSANETKDHVHQKSAWFCHGDVIPDGVTLKVRSSDKRVEGVDFWAESPNHGVIQLRGDLLISDNQATFTAVWNAPEGLTVLMEKRTYQFDTVAGGHLISMTSVLAAPNEFGVTFGDTKEGAFGIRVSDSLRETLKGGDGLLSNADGKAKMKECWGYPSDWCDYSGTINGKKVGVAVFDHPKNAQRSYWHARDYGLMAANPFGRKVSGFPAAKDKTELVKLKARETMTFRYAIFAHDGDAKTGKVAEAFKSYSERK